ncbi:MAG TPA: class I SAM-dependent methyltransferase [Rhodanobacteraceae bacterium]|nr:class I SAM-dependent methyltransferase [Rhodanobacteraceae bacterium]
MATNLDPRTVESFGDEWSRFDQRSMPDAEATAVFAEYFAVFPWAELPERASGFDMGCGSGRWARLVAPRVGHLHLIDPSSALDGARRLMDGQTNVTFHRASLDDGVLPEGSQDFGYSLGVLHHVPDTTGAIRSCVAMLKPGAPFLVYLYYAFDNRGLAFRTLWKVSDWLRRGVCRLPARAKHVVTDLIALSVYLPLARFSAVLERLGRDTSSFPLAYYRRRSWFTMRTDSRDRFGTPLEQRFTQAQIRQMVEAAGLCDVKFSDHAPYWCAVGLKKAGH